MADERLYNSVEELVRAQTADLPGQAQGESMLAETRFEYAMVDLTHKQLNLTIPPAELIEEAARENVGSINANRAVSQLVVRDFAKNTWEAKLTPKEAADAIARIQRAYARVDERLEALRLTLTIDMVAGTSAESVPTASDRPPFTETIPQDPTPPAALEEPIRPTLRRVDAGAKKAATPIHTPPAPAEKPKPARSVIDRSQTSDTRRDVVFGEGAIHALANKQAETAEAVIANGHISSEALTLKVERGLTNQDRTRAMGNIANLKVSLRRLRSPYSIESVPNGTRRADGVTLVLMLNGKPVNPDWEKTPIAPKTAPVRKTGPNTVIPPRSDSTGTPTTREARVLFDDSLDQTAAMPTRADLAEIRARTAENELSEEELQILDVNLQLNMKRTNLEHAQDVDVVAKMHAKELEGLSGPEYYGALQGFLKDYARAINEACSKIRTYQWSEIKPKTVEALLWRLEGFPQFQGVYVADLIRVIQRQPGWQALLNSNTPTVA